MKHPSHGAGIVISNEASNHKDAPFPQLSSSDEVIMLKKEVGALAFINLLVPFADMWDIKLPGPRAIPEYSAEQPG